MLQDERVQNEKISRNIQKQLFSSLFKEKPAEIFKTTTIL